MGSLDDLVHDLRKFERRKEIVKALRKRIREPVPKIRRSIKARALATMPKSGGLNIWVSRTKVTAQVKFTGRKAGVKLRGARNSQKKKSDLRRLDAGRLRHPSWGKRGEGQWHLQGVPSGFFSGPSAEMTQWRDACLNAVDDALKTIRG